MMVNRGETFRFCLTIMLIYMLSIISFICAYSIWYAFSDYPCPLGEDASDWETFNSVKHNIQFKYPPGYNIQETMSFIQLHNINHGDISSHHDSMVIQKAGRSLKTAIESAESADYGIGSWQPLPIIDTRMLIAKLEDIGSRPDDGTLRLISLHAKVPPGEWNDFLRWGTKPDVSQGDIIRVDIIAMPPKEWERMGECTGEAPSTVPEVIDWTIRLVD